MTPLLMSFLFRYSNILFAFGIISHSDTPFHIMLSASSNETDNSMFMYPYTNRKKFFSQISIPLPHSFIFLNVLFTILLNS